MKKGFTLIEMIIVIAILAIISAILVPSIAGYKQKAEKTKFSEDAKGLSHAIHMYEADYEGTISDVIDSNDIYKLKNLVDNFPSEYFGKSKSDVEAIANGDEIMYRQGNSYIIESVPH